MSTLSPKTKQALSALAVGVAGTVLETLHQALVTPPITLHSLLVALATGVAFGFVHRVPALGTEQAVATKLIEKEPK